MQLINILLEIVVFIIMVSVGSSISFREIKEVFKKPRKILIGLFLQIVVLPLIAIIIAYFAPISPLYKIGIVILSACPGGAMSNFISYLIKADVPLSVGLTSTNSFVTILTIPLYSALSVFIFLGNTVSIELPTLSIIYKILLMVILPVIIGMWFRHKNENMVNIFQRPAKIISMGLLLVVFLVKFLAGPELGGSSLDVNIIKIIIPYLLLLNLSGLLVGYFVSKKMGFSKKSSSTMGIEVGLQNTVLTLLITDVILNNVIMGHPALVYAMFSFVSTLLFGMISVRYDPIANVKFRLYNLIYRIRTYNNK